MKELVVVVVGGGATAVSLLGALIAAAKDEPHRPRLVLYLIERRRSGGRGLAYDDDVASNLLNTRAGFITPFPDKPGHFFAWLQENRDTWRDLYPTLDVDAQTFVPRSLFGLYLECALADLCTDLMRLGGSMIRVTAEATDIERTAEGRLVVSTDSALAIRADRVVLSCGNLQSRDHAGLERQPGVHASPYPIRRLQHGIDKSASVAVLGARLSAVDVVLGLLDGGHRGPLTVFSRSGYLPSVRGTQGRYTPTLLTAATIEAHRRRHGHVPLAQIADWLCEEVGRASGERLAPMTAPPPPPHDPLGFLEREIAAAAGPRPWQAVLYATNGLVDLIWRALPEAERRIFMERYQAAWMAYRVSIPVENAERLLAAGRDGRVVFRSGATRIVRADDGPQLAIGPRGQERTERFGAIVCAYGSPRDPRQLDSTLVANLLSRGFVRAHAHGGLDVSPASGRALGANGLENPDITVLGELTAGVHFFTSALEINARHAGAQARAIIADHMRPATSGVLLRLPDPERLVAEAAG